MLKLVKAHFHMQLKLIVARIARKPDNDSEVSDRTLDNSIGTHFLYFMQCKAKLAESSICMLTQSRWRSSNLGSCFAKFNRKTFDDRQ